MSKQHSYIDIHGHVNFPAYDADRADVIKRAEDAGVAMITVGTQIDTSRSAVALAEKHDSMFAVVGLHPIHNAETRDNVGSYRDLALHPKVLAIGECGLDYYRSDDESIGLQRHTFIQMIEVANEVQKPLMLHIRNGIDRSAYKDAYEILKEHSKVLGDLHFFAGSIEEARPFLDLGYSFSFTGVVTFARDYDDIVKYIPKDRIMSETDCPYVSPTPYRGKRNEPLYVIEVVRALAEIRGENEFVMAEQIIENARRFFSVEV